MNWQDRYRWFEDWTGVDEEDFLAHREKHIVALDDGDLALFWNEFTGNTRPTAD